MLSLISAVLVLGPQSIAVARAETQTPSQQNTTPEPQKSMGPAAPAAPKQVCPGNPDPLGVARVVEIDTTGGPGFGFQHYKEYDFLQPKEVVLTFDDGPLPGRTTAILAALEAQCTKATFFPVGKVAGGYPEILRDVAKADTPLAPIPSITKTSPR
jgi:peptidoglycan/xylan/chitin deacetylase (PgdA/CDA1 family)